MLYELETDQFDSVLPLFEKHLQDPLLHAVIEGQREGRIFVNRPENLKSAFVWTNSESVYFVSEGGNDQLYSALRRLILKEIIPAAKSVGLTFLSLFSFPNSQSEPLTTLFQDQLPLRTPLSTFVFDRETFFERRDPSYRLPAGFTLKRADQEMLETAGNETLAENAAFHWGSVEDFLSRGSGHCVLKDEQIVSCCYVQARGCQSQTIDIWTVPEQRRKGFATAVGDAFIQHCLSEGETPFWICDEANAASRRLAERLGFKHREVICLVDIPFDPFDFYKGLADHFFLPQRRYRQAAQAYEKAFTVQGGEAQDYYNTAIAWASAGEDDKALAHLEKAIDCGWTDLAALEREKAFQGLRATKKWLRLVDR